MANRVLLNQNGLKITKAGYNVLTDTDQGHISFDTAFGGFGMRIAGSITIAAASGDSVSFTDLGYIPFAAVGRVDGSGLDMPYIRDRTGGSGFQEGFYYNVYANQLAIQNRESASQTFYYAVFWKAIS